jgi:hypothetical protein
MLMMVKKQLDERIVGILTKPCRSAEAAETRAEAEEELSRVTAEADAADIASLSPLATAADAHKLRAKAADLRFEGDRLEAQVSALSARVADLKDEERRSVEQAERDDAIAERDRLAADIAAEYPGIVRSMTELVKRIEESDQRLLRCGVHESAEAIARGMPANFYRNLAPLIRLRDARLSLPDGTRQAWDYNGANMERVWPGLDVEPLDQKGR